MKLGWYYHRPFKYIKHIFIMIVSISEISENQVHVNEIRYVINVNYSTCKFGEIKETWNNITNCIILQSEKYFSYRYFQKKIVYEGISIFLSRNDESNNPVSCNPNPHECVQYVKKRKFACLISWNPNPHSLVQYIKKRRLIAFFTCCMTL